MKKIFVRWGTPRGKALRIALIYAAIGFGWIAFSDLAVNLIFGKTWAALWAHTLKGWFFVATTAFIVYSLTSKTIETVRESQDALRESQRVLATFFGNLPGMAYRCRADFECTLEFVSLGAFDLTGYFPADLTDKQKINDLILEEDREKVGLEMTKALSEKRPFRLAYRIRSADGQIKWVWEQGLGVYDESGQLMAIEGYITDITERKRAEEALTRSEQIYRALAEGTSDAILMVDRNRDIISVNQAFIELFGFTRKELEGQSVRLVHPSEESFADFGKAAYPALEGAPLRIEWELKKKDGTIFPIEGTYSAIKAPDGSIAGHVGIIRDITERRKTERELREHREHLEEMVRQRTRELEEAQKALVHREKLKTLGAIAAEVAHEIRNPLVSIGGFARRLQKKQPDAVEAAIILQESRRLEILVNRISGYLRPIEIKPGECYVNAILSEAVEALELELKRKRVRLRLELAPDLPPAHVDADILAQIFVTVIRSAASMMEEQRDLTVRSYEAEQAVCADIAFPATRKVNPELMLLPFYEDEKGVGISSSFRLLKAMGGTLSYAEADSQGIFTISLVKCDESAHKKASGAI